jgi:hypothetical protein
VIHYISAFNPTWHNECQVATALEWHGQSVECYEYSHANDRPGRNGAPAVKADDVVFTAVPQCIPVDELKRYKDAGAKLACWYWDWLWGLEQRDEAYTPRLQLMDSVLSTDGFDDAEYVKRGVTCRHWLAQAAMPEDRLLIGNGPRHDVVFMGHIWTDDRREMRRRLSERFNFANYGNYSYDAQVHHRIWGREMVSICQGAKIMLGTNYRNDIPGYWSDRIYVVMGAGGFYLGQYVPGLESQFKDGVHCAFYDGMDDMEEKVAWWLSHDAERERCRKAGHKLIHKCHTYIHRVGDLLEVWRRLELIR